MVDSPFRRMRRGIKMFLHPKLTEEERGVVLGKEREGGL